MEQVASGFDMELRAVHLSATCLGARLDARRNTAAGDHMSVLRHTLAPTCTLSRDGQSTRAMRHDMILRTDRIALGSHEETD